MARTALAVQEVRRTGLTPAFAAANVDGHSVPNEGRTWLHVKAGVTPVTVTLETPGTVDGLAVADRTVVVAASSERLIGPCPPGIYNQPGTGELFVNFDQVSGITIAAFRL